jgi:osmotically-inducible protein OsmY
MLIFSLLFPGSGAKNIFAGKAFMKSDLDLQRDVQTRLELEPKIDPAAVGVSVEAGVVTLRGSVENEEDRACTERAVRFIPGVKGLVDDDLKVQSADRSRPKDSELETQAREAIQWLTTVPQDTIKVSAQGGWLKLEGEVEFRHQSQSIEGVLRDIPGVHGIKNLLAVKAENKAA